MTRRAWRSVIRALGGLVFIAMTGDVTVASEGRPASRISTAPALEQALAVCVGHRPSADTAAIAASFTSELAVTEPLLALELACRTLADAAATIEPRPLVDRMLDVAESALHAGELDAARRIFESLLGFASEDADTVVTGDRLARLHVGRGDLANTDADGQLAQRHFAQAEAALETAGMTDSVRHAAVLVGEATAWRHERLPGALHQAATALDRAAAILETHGMAVSLDMSGVLNERTLVAYARLDLAGTIDAARAEVDLYRRLGFQDSIAPLDALVTLGGVLSQLGRNDEAEIALREALRLVDLHPAMEPAAALGILNNYAALQSDRGRYTDALAMAERALAYARNAFGVGAARTLTPLTSQAQTLSRLGRYGEARRSFEEALAVTAVHAAGVGPLRRVRLQDALATTLIVLGETAAAEQTIDQGLQETAALEGLGYWQGRLWRQRAAMAARREDWPAASGAIAEAIARVGPVNGEHHPFVIDMGSLRCFAETQGHIAGRACANLAAAVRELDGAAPGYRFNAMAALAQDDDNQGRPDAALARRLQALAAAESAATPDPLWSAYAALAEQMRARGLRQLSVLLAKQAVEQIERMRASFDADAKRYERGFLANKLDVYRHLADWLTEDDRIDEALDVLRLLKEEEFYDFANRDGGLFGRAEPGPAFADAEAPLRRLWGPRSADVGQVATAAPRREDARVAQWIGLLDDRRDPPFPSKPSAPVHPAFAPSAATPTTAPRDSPPGREARVWIYPGDRRVNLVIDGPTRRATVAVDKAPADIARLLTGLLGAIERRESVLDRLQALHALLGAPIERSLAAEGVERIVLTIDGPLRYLPFAALHDGRGFMGERYSIEQRVPALPTAVETAGPLRATTTLRVQAMGVSRGLAGLAPLDEVANEVCGIVAGPVVGLGSGQPACGSAGIGHGAIRGAGWMNDEFTAARLRTVVDSSRSGGNEATLLHIGTHFVLRPGRMSRSWLLLGDGRPLSLEDLGRLDFRGQSLVTLSACETGIGGAQGLGSGAEVDGLGGLMLRHGAGGVVASLWRVNDASTSRLMQAFYRELAAGVAPAEALRRAQARLRDAGGREAHPFYWAGFYLVTGSR